MSVDSKRIDDTVDLDYREALEILKHEGAITDGMFVYGLSYVRILNAYEIPHIVKYEEWDAYPKKFILQADFEAYFKKRDWHPYRIPLTAEQAVNEMMKGATVEDIENYQRMYFMRTLKHPFDGFVAYIFRLQDKSSVPELVGTVDEWPAHDAGPHYEIVKTESESKEEKE